MKTNGSEGIRKLSIAAMLSAVAYIVMVIVHLPLVPAAPFLTYDPKDVVITIGGFLFGPFYAFCMSAAVAFLEMITVSDTGLIGFFMQIIATLAFAGTASLVYRRKHVKSGAELGLLLGIVCMTAVMVLWNYLLTPIYLGTDRTAVVALLAPAIIPFNVVKGIINALLIRIIYKPLVRTLRKGGLLPESK